MKKADVRKFNIHEIGGVHIPWPFCKLEFCMKHTEIEVVMLTKQDLETRKLD